MSLKAVIMFSVSLLQIKLMVVEFVINMADNHSVCVCILVHAE